MFQNPDGRIIFTIPYEQNYTLIGTTDAPYALSDGSIEISDAETTLSIWTLPMNISKRPITKNDIVWSYAGVRPLYDNKKQNASAVTRDYVFDLMDNETGDNTPPILSIFGGKITTYRELSEHALKKLRKHFPDLPKRWTGSMPLPGGDINTANFERLLHNFGRPNTRGWDNINLRRMARAYGTRITLVIDAAASQKEMGRAFGGGLNTARSHVFTNP